MELHERKDFIQIDYKDGKFQTVCITNVTPILGTNQDNVDFGILQRFNNNLEECIKFTVGAMSAVRLFHHKEYRPVDYIEIIYTKEAKQRIVSKRYRVAEYIYPDLKEMKEVWKNGYTRGNV